MKITNNFRAAAVLVLLAAVLTACSKTAEPGGDKGGDKEQENCQIVLWHYYNDVQQNAFAQLVDEYNRTEGAEKHITVQAYSQGSISELTNKMELVLDDSANQVESANMYMAYRDMASTVWRSNPDILVDCSQYFSKEDLEQYNPAYIDEGYFQDKLYIIPMAKSTELLMMNQTEMDRFMDANPQYTAEDMTTWEGLARVAQGYYEWTDSLTPDVPWDGRPFIGIDTLANYFIVSNHAMGSDIYHYDDQGGLVLDLNETYIKRLFENYYIPFTKGYYGASGKYRSDDIKQSFLAGYIGSSSSTLFFPQEVADENGDMVPIDMGVYPYPYLEGAKKTAIQQGAGIVTINKSQRENEACMDFIRWLTMEHSFEMASSMSYMPVGRGELSQEQKDTVKDSRVLSALNVGLAQSGEYQMVYGFDFKNSYDVRQSLEQSFLSALSEGREEFQGYLNAGKTMEEAAQLMNYDKKSADFYQRVKGLFGE